MIEFAASFRPRPIRHVLMDWDGTTALSRAGWGEVMTDVYVENLPPLAGESAEARRVLAWEELMRLNGRPSIHQMAHLADLIRQRGGEPADAAHYQTEFQRRLGELVQRRLDDVRAGRRSADSLLVPGLRALLETLHARRIGLTLASGTPFEQLHAEAVLLDVTRYFDGRIFGPKDLDDRTFTKREIIAGIVAAGETETLLAFGDGPAEIIETKAIGGLAVAVASDENDPGSGRMDPWKREALLAAGADAVIADFRAVTPLLSKLGLLGPSLEPAPH